MSLLQSMQNINFQNVIFFKLSENSNMNYNIKYYTHTE